jgi:hypothetical protein
MIAASCGRTTVDNSRICRRFLPRSIHSRSIHGSYAKDLPQGKQGSNSAVSSQSIAADLAAFRKGGGKIEVLGNTLALKKAG